MIVHALSIVAVVLQLLGISSAAVEQHSAEPTTIPSRIRATKSVGVMISAPSGVVVDATSGKVLWHKDAETQRPIASISKLITLLAWMELEVPRDQVVTIQREDQRDVGGNRQVYLGEQMTVLQLLHSALIASDNEAVMALIRAAGYEEQEFVAYTNDWLARNGFEKTIIIDPTGLDKGNISTALEIVGIATRAFAIPEIATIAQKAQYSFTPLNGWRTVRLQNTNELLSAGFGVKMGKTGYIPQAGYCLTTVAQLPTGQQVYTVVLGSPEMNDRFQDTKAVLSWVGNNYHWNE